MKRWVPGRLAAVATIGIASAVLVGVLAQNRPPEELVTTGDKPDAVLMYTGDVIGYLEPCG